MKVVAILVLSTALSYGLLAAHRPGIAALVLGLCCVYLLAITPQR